jgi:NAD(P)H-flavin reductase
VPPKIAKRVATYGFEAGNVASFGQFFRVSTNERRGRDRRKALGVLSVPKEQDPAALPSLIREIGLTIA